MPRIASPRAKSRLWRALRWAVPRFVTRKYNYTCDELEEEAPCLIVSNHVTNLDPAFVGLSLRSGPPAFVASEHLMRQGLISRLIERWFTPIPRSKAASGASTVKSCLRRIRSGESVVLFAEGDCTWDGLSHEVFPATGKLAKAAGAPLVTYRIEGGYLTHPRWSEKARSMKMHGGPVRVYSPEELKAMTPEQVTEAIDRDIFVDAWASQLKDKLPIPSRRRAEGLERALVLCPKCGGFGTLSSKDNTVFCTKCGCNAYVEEDGFFADDAPFSNIAGWEAWQKAELTRLMAEGAELSCEPVECELTVIRGEEKRSKKRRAELSMDTAGRALVINGERLPFDRIDDVSMVKTTRLLFTTDEGYYELKSDSTGLRRFMLAVRAAKGLL
ncbi:MAG: 1-acyl-sn-glycerol-3-phosphate acyltransferase [Clostridia bacterium]|nr:1-acyl-sn-glycerol-3-phosphate acyltransferase [Clostridia bacterium]